MMIMIMVIMIMMIIMIMMMIMIMLMMMMMVAAVVVNGSKSNTEERHMTDTRNQDNSHFPNTPFTFFSFSLMLECIFWYGCFGLIQKQLLRPSLGHSDWLFPPAVGGRGRRGWKRQVHSSLSPLHSVGPKTQRMSLRIPPKLAYSSSTHVKH